MALDRVSSDRIREIRHERKKKSRMRFFVATLSLVVIVASVVFISRASQLQITSVVVRGNYIVPTDDVRSLVESTLDQHYLYFFPKRNVFLYPSRILTNQITSHFPKFETVTVSRQNWNTLIIDVTERKNLYLYCDALPLASDVEPHCYYVDAHGYVFSPSPIFSGNVYFVFLGNFNWSDGETPIGKQIAPENIFSELVRFKEGLEENNLTPYGLRIYPDGTYAFLLSPVLDDTSQKIIFSTTDDITSAYTDFVSALSADALKSELSEHFDKLEYINLQYGKTVYNNGILGTVAKAVLLSCADGGRDRSCISPARCKIFPAWAVGRRTRCILDGIRLSEWPDEFGTGSA